MSKKNWVDTMIEVNKYLLSIGKGDKNFENQIVNCPVNGKTIPDKPKRTK